MIEHRIYSSWAFSENEDEKARINVEIYNGLKEKYKVYRNDLYMNLQNGEHCNFEDYDVVIGRRAGYKHALYRVHKNKPNLSYSELALLCDQGSLCFGFSTNGNLIRVFED